MSNKDCYVLGISALYHDSSAALIKNGEIIAAVQEERFTRVKFDASFPYHSINYCLREAGIAISDLNSVVFYEDTHLKLDRIIRCYTRYLPKSIKVFRKASKVWFSGRLNSIQDGLKNLGYENKCEVVSHHLSHAASAYYPSGFKKAAILVVDGVGEWASTSIGIGENNNVKLIKEIKYPHSLGILYSAFTQYCGFRVNSGEYKLMGLAPYGSPVYKDLILDKLIDLKKDGSYRLNLKYFDFHHGFTTINSRFEKLFGKKARKPESDIEQHYEDIAASIQEVFNEIILMLAKTARNITGMSDLVYAGGVALNCVANGYLQREKIFDNIWIQPAAGDAGGALGAALYFYYHKINPNGVASRKRHKSFFLGPSYSNDEIKHSLEMYDFEYDFIKDEDDLIKKTSGYLSDGKVVGWFQGRMEYGPRALGARSILGDTRSPVMQKHMNLKIKYRESFRPFAPAVLNEHAREYFETDNESPYMLFIANVAKDKLISADDSGLHGIDKLNMKRSVVPAITHVDNSARFQTVDLESNRRFYKLISEFHKVNNCPMVVNTSFNVRGEPIVNSPIDALQCFLSTEIDILVMENFIVERSRVKMSKSGFVSSHPDFLKLNE